jgi:hypothetical protein
MLGCWWLVDRLWDWFDGDLNRRSLGSGLTCFRFWLGASFCDWIVQRYGTGPGWRPDLNYSARIKEEITIEVGT